MVETASAQTKWSTETEWHTSPRCGSTMRLQPPFANDSLRHSLSLAICRLQNCLFFSLCEEVAQTHTRTGRLTLAPSGVKSIRTNATGIQRKRHAPKLKAKRESMKVGANVWNPGVGEMAEATVAAAAAAAAAARVYSVSLASANRSQCRP